MAASYNKFNCFVEDVAEAKHNFASHTFTVALTNVAPVAGNTVLANLTEINYANCSSRTVTISTHAQAGGTLTVVPTDVVLTAGGGTVGPFQYAVIYNGTTAGNPLIGWYNYGSSITLQDGETFTLDFGASGLFTLA